MANFFQNLGSTVGGAWNEVLRAAQPGLAQRADLQLAENRRQEEELKQRQASNEQQRLSGIQRDFLEFASTLDPNDPAAMSNLSMYFDDRIGTLKSAIPLIKQGRLTDAQKIGALDTFGTLASGTEDEAARQAYGQVASSVGLPKEVATGMKYQPQITGVRTAKTDKGTNLVGIKDGQMTTFGGWQEPAEKPSQTSMMNQDWDTLKALFGKKGAVAQDYAKQLDSFNKKWGTNKTMDEMYSAYQWTPQERNAVEVDTGKTVKAGDVIQREVIDSDPITRQPLEGAKPRLIPWKTSGEDADMGKFEEDYTDVAEQIKENKMTPEAGRARLIKKGYSTAQVNSVIPKGNDDEPWNNKPMNVDAKVGELGKPASAPVDTSAPELPDVNQPDYEALKAQQGKALLSQLTDEQRNIFQGLPENQKKQLLDILRSGNLQVIQKALSRLKNDNV